MLNKNQHGGVMGQFYVYEHWRPDTNVCFWVGKGSKRRAYEFGRNNAAYNAVVYDLTQKELLVEVRFVFKHLSEELAYKVERTRVLYWKAQSDCYLTNKTQGGAGCKGLVKSTEEREYLRALRLGTKASEAARAKMRASAVGKVLTEEHKRNIAASKLGKKRGPNSPKHNAKIAAGNTGKKMSGETRAKMSAIQSNRSPETRAKLSSALTGRTLTPEHIAKLKAAVRPPHTEEHKAKMREGQARRASRTPEHKARIAAAITAWHAQRKQEQ